jgi:hypothetical protein
MAAVAPDTATAVLMSARTTTEGVARRAGALAPTEGLRRRVVAILRVGEYVRVGQRPGGYYVASNFSRSDFKNLQHNRAAGRQQDS